MKTLKKLTALLFAAVFVCVCLAGCGEKEIISIEDDPEYGAAIDPKTITEDEVKSVLLGLMEYCKKYQSLVTDSSLSTALRASNIDYTLPENEGYYPLASVYGVTSYNSIINGFNKYFTPEYAEMLVKYLKGTDGNNNEVERFKMIGGILHVFAEFKGKKTYENGITAKYDTFTITERTDDSFTIKIYAKINGKNGTQSVKFKKINGNWYMDGWLV